MEVQTPCRPIPNNNKKPVNKYKKEEAALLKRLAVVQGIRSGDKPADEIAKLIKSQKFSYGIKFTRKNELLNVAKPGLSFTSDRRFATRKEATQHGKRFAKKHGHKSFQIVRLNKRANAWINWETGKTNPVL